MENKNLKTSSKMAFFMGLALPFAESIRRANQLLDYKAFFLWFDDYLLGGIMVWAAYCVFKKVKNAIAYLVAVWGIATGALFQSFLGEFKYFQMDSGDPGIFSTAFVVIAKGLILIYMFVGLVKAVKANSIASQGHH